VVKLLQNLDFLLLTSSKVRNFAFRSTWNGAAAIKFARFFRSTDRAPRKPSNAVLPSSSSLPSMKSPKRKRISDAKGGVLMVDQVKATVPEGTAVRFDLSKGKGIK
jgi:hypothetical protein